MIFFEKIKLNTMVLCFYGVLWTVVLELVNYPDHNKGPDPRTFSMSQDLFIDPNHTTDHTTNQLITRPLSGSPNCAW